MNNDRKNAGPILFGAGWIPTDVKTGEVVNREDPEVAAMLKHNEAVIKEVFGLNL